MSGEILGEMDFLLHSACLGVMITVLYDVIRIFRRLIRHRNFWVSVEDLLFWVVCAVCMFALLYRENNGVLRWFVVLGAAAGMLLYRATVSRLFVSAAVAGGGFLLERLGRLLRFLTRPLRKSGRFLKNQLTKGWKMFKIVLCKQ